MAAVQTQLQFNVRKKRFGSSKSIAGKENSDVNNLRTLRNTNRIIDEELSQKKNVKKVETIVLSSDDSDNDSKIECTEIKNCDRSTLKRSTRYARKLQLSDTEDESADEKKIKSPPKRGKTIEDTSVRTEILSPQTPSQFISRLHLKTPSSDSSIGKCESEKHLPPKCLFSTGSSYQQVRQALQSSAQTSMPGREEQLEKLQSFLSDHLSDKTSGTLYISGPPGTGKTACLSKVMEVPEFKNGYKIINVNCTSMKSSGSIYARIAQELGLKTSKRNEKEYLSSIERYLMSNHRMILLVLDEIDQLDSRKQSVLYTIFEWPSNPSSRLVLIGIANALDLTDRILPRLQARLDLKPKLLHFPPYTKMQIVNILTERIKQSEVSDMFPQAALQLLAGKVASTCGDVRRALDIARRVVEIAEAQRSKLAMPLQPTAGHAANRLSPMKLLHNNITTSPRKSPRKNHELSPCKTPQKKNEMETLSLKEITPGIRTSPRKSPRKNPDLGCVSLRDVMAVLNGVYGVSQSLATDCDESFPLQQKVLVATLLLVIKKGRSKDVTVGKLHEVYRRVCQKKNLLAVDQAEFLSLCQLVETRGILRVQGRKEARLSKVCLQWDEEEVSSALKDKQLLASILNDTSCLS